MIPLKDNNRIPKFPFWTIGIILLNIYIFYLELNYLDPDRFINTHALIASQVNFLNIQSLFPFISSQFLHGGFLHIISNMTFLWVFGNNIEAVLGFRSFPIFYLLSGVVAGLTQYFFSPTDSIPMLGASGAVAGVLGAYFARFPYNKIKTLVLIFVFITIVDIPAFALLFFWFVTQFFSGVASITFNSGMGGIAFLPHIGGFLFGWLAAILTAPRKNYSQQFKFS